MGIQFNGERSFEYLRCLFPIHTKRRCAFEGLRTKEKHFPGPIEINNEEVLPVLFKVRLSELEASSLEAVVIACPPNDWQSPPQAFFSAGTGCIGNGADDAGNLQEERLL
ncbi:hypothetical protein CDAR_549781 [Caerostris darwini]|uniref:Uncharacterized protein n=1 Tax=Caerostris darwini TaxID=1538125 RepID=A0AAV4NT01_9ARAC|nr:hypothetical protein CDAR_549781 [Caerostris darwini]